jgi:(S)-2-hydroxyglutarate dehydrogenase
VGSERSAPQAADGAPASCDLAVVGGGILGLAVARELIRRHPGSSLCVLERESRLAAHQSGHSSGVIHAGIYYAPGSLKARLCVDGARELYSYCEQHAIAHVRCGKVILAARHEELSRLEELERRGRANGVLGLRLIGPRNLEAIEPHARAIRALHSPNTGVVDFTLVAQSFAFDIQEAGGAIATGWEVSGVERAGRRLRLTGGNRAIEAKHAIFCAGAWSDRLAQAAGAGSDPRIVPFRGAYLRLRPERRGLVRALIYPVPDPALPFLGTHISRRIDGEVLLGPTALIAGARDAYRIAHLRGRDVLETLVWPGTWRMLARWWRTGILELRHAASSAALVRSAARYLPELAPEDVGRGPAGVRAQALWRDGRLLDDFLFARTERALHVRNAPSPGATASLAIARHIADQADAAFELDA